MAPKAYHSFGKQVWHAKTLYGFDMLVCTVYGIPAWGSRLYRSHSGRGQNAMPRFGLLHMLTYACCWCAQSVFVCSSCQYRSMSGFQVKARHCNTVLVDLPESSVLM